ncbi:hypothetical protein BD779DRAFT_911017 [Infundibulicybe gibba]|nr:hypothetical protein BD779DRAFT_911017 [Infundibulicybe gibba]
MLNFRLLLHTLQVLDSLVFHKLSPHWQRGTPSLSNVCEPVEDRRTIADLPTEILSDIFIRYLEVGVLCSEMRNSTLAEPHCFLPKYAGIGGLALSGKHPSPFAFHIGTFSGMDTRQPCCPPTSIARENCGSRMPGRPNHHPSMTSSLIFEESLSSSQIYTLIGTTGTTLHHTLILSNTPLC